jgi:periplasmic divalent cation tolerance protein
MIEGAGVPAADPDLVVVVTTLDGRAVAERLVHQLIEEQLIACGNLIPGMTSLYRWKGAVERATEVLVLLKTPRAKLEQLFRRVAELHPYELPELVVLSVEAVSHAYAGWVRQETNEVSA